MKFDFQDVKNGAVSTYNFLNDNIAINGLRSVTRMSLRAIYNKCSGAAVSSEAQVNADRVIDRHVDYFVNKGINPLNIAAFTLSHDTPIGMAAYGLVTALEMGTAILSTRKAKQGEFEQEPAVQWIGTRSLLAAGLLGVACTQGLNVGEAWEVLKDDFGSRPGIIPDDILEIALHTANTLGALYVAKSSNLWQRDVYKGSSVAKPATLDVVM